MKKTIIKKNKDNKYWLFTGHNTGSVESGKKYRPLFLDHFDKKEAPEIGKVRFIHVYINVFLYQI